MDFKNKVSVFLILFFSLNLANAQPGLLEKLHGDLIDSCKEVLYCKQADLDRCIAEFRNAFSACDPIFMKNPKNPNMNAYTTCVVEKSIAASTEIFISFDDGCEAKDKIAFFYVSEATHPPDNPQVVEFFTRGSFDWDDIKLYSNPELACEGGAARIKALTEKNAAVKVTIDIVKVDKFTGVTIHEGGAGETAFSHVFTTPAYKAGACFGSTTTEILESDYYYKKGEVIVSEYRDDIFVAVQCNKQPMNEVCEK